MKTNNIHIRPAAVAGQFYPADTATLDEMISTYLQQANTDTSEQLPRALIVPHAGYVYSGPVAASAYAALAPLRGKIKRVVLLGPAHRVGFSGIAASSADAFRTPLGDIPLDTETLKTLSATLPNVGYLDEAHAQEHSLEVHLPFLQKVLGQFKLLPFVVGEAEPEDVAALLEVFIDDPQTLLVISSDLSHYHDYQSAQRIDTQTAQKIRRLDYQYISPQEACGAYPVRGLLLAAQKHGLVPHEVDLRNSGDTAGDRSHVVGYGAWLFYPETQQRAGKKQAEEVVA